MISNVKNKKCYNMVLIFSFSSIIIVICQWEIVLLKKGGGILTISLSIELNI